MNMKISIAGAVAIPAIPGLMPAPEMTLAEKVLAAVASDFADSRDIVMFHEMPRDKIGVMDMSSGYFVAKGEGDDLQVSILGCGPFGAKFAFQKADDTTYFHETSSGVAVLRVTEPAPVQVPQATL